MSFFDRLRNAAANANTSSTSDQSGTPSQTITLIGNANARVVISAQEAGGRSLEELREIYAGELGLTTTNLAWKFEGNTITGDVVPTPGSVYRAYTSATEKG